MTRVVTLIGADGTEHTLACGTDPYVLGRASGIWGGVGHNLKSRQVAQVPGRQLEAMTWRSRIFAVPIVIEAATQQQADDRIAALGSILDPTADVIVRYTRPDGVQREITARHKEGFTNLSARRDVPHTIPIVPLVFEAFSPFWRDPTENIQEVSEPWDNGLAAGSNELIIANAGDVESWPEIEITGEGENIEGMSMTTGQVWRVRRELVNGDVLRIVTDPAERAVYLNNVLAWSAMDEISTFWPIVPRTNHVIIRAIGQTANFGTFAIRFRQLYQTC